MFLSFVKHLDGVGHHDWTQVRLTIVSSIGDHAVHPISSAAPLGNTITSACPCRTWYYLHDQATPEAPHPTPPPLLAPTCRQRPDSTTHTPRRHSRPPPPIPH